MTLIRSHVSERPLRAMALSLVEPTKRFFAWFCIGEDEKTKVVGSGYGTTPEEATTAATTDFGLRAEAKLARKEKRGAPVRTRAKVGVLYEIQLSEELRLIVRERDAPKPNAPRTALPDYRYVARAMRNGNQIVSYAYGRTPKEAEDRLREKL